MDSKMLSAEELDLHHPGEALTLTTVLVVFTVAILAVVAYKLFSSEKGKAQLQGFKFEWGSFL
ncbi:MAG TPA: hypothetical protein DEA63_00070 [Firmicutes bacterium]|nr:hypothetical protein [Bacillota bacterium]